MNIYRYIWMWMWMDRSIDRWISIVVQLFSTKTSVGDVGTRPGEQARVELGESTPIHIYLYMCVCVCVCMHVCVHICMHVYIYIYTYIHTYIHTYIYVHTYLCPAGRNAATTRVAYSNAYLAYSSLPVET